MHRQPHLTAEFQDLQVLLHLAAVAAEVLITRQAQMAGQLVVVQQTALGMLKAQ
jgi:hypothetical protein